MNERRKFYEAAKKWQKVEQHWPVLPPACRALTVINQKLKTIAPLLDLPKLEQLRISVLREQDLEVLVRLNRLRVLFLRSVNTNSLAPLGALKNLEFLDIQNASKLASLQGLENLRRLRLLEIYHIPRVRDLKPLANLTNLEELSIQMSYGTDQKLRFKSLQPLSGLRKLCSLELIGVQPLDGSLKPLSRLQNLKELQMSFTMPIREYAFLAARLTKTRAECLRPFVTLPNGTSLVCRKCKTKKVLLVGKSSQRSRQFVCRSCDQERFAEHVRMFERLANQARNTK